MNYSDDDLEIHAWPVRSSGGQHVGTYGHGVLLIHRPTGVAVVCTDKRSQMQNRADAVEKLHKVLNMIPRDMLQGDAL